MGIESMLCPASGRVKGSAGAFDADSVPVLGPKRRSGEGFRFKSSGTKTPRRFAHLRRPEEWLCKRPHHELSGQTGDESMERNCPAGILPTMQSSVPTKRAFPLDCGALLFGENSLDRFGDNFQQGSAERY